MNKSQSSAYIDAGVLQQWNSQMSEINKNATDILDSYLTTVKDLEKYMLGNVATGFINDSSDLITNSKKCHAEMQNVEKFLIEVINTMSNQ